jgi:hypothetical protein
LEIKKYLRERSRKDKGFEMKEMGMGKVLMKIVISKIMEI